MSRPPRAQFFPNLRQLRRISKWRSSLWSVASNSKVRRAKNHQASISQNPLPFANLKTTKSPSLRAKAKTRNSKKSSNSSRRMISNNHRESSHLKRRGANSTRHQPKNHKRISHKRNSDFQRGKWRFHMLRHHRSISQRLPPRNHLEADPKRLQSSSKKSLQTAERRSVLPT